MGKKLGEISLEVMRLSAAQTINLNVIGSETALGGHNSSVTQTLPSASPRNRRFSHRGRRYHFTLYGRMDLHLDDIHLAPHAKRSQLEIPVPPLDWKRALVCRGA